MKNLLAFKLSILAALLMMTTANTCEFTEFNTPSSVATSTPFSTNGTIKNLMPDNLGAFPIDVVLSYDRHINPEDKLLGQGTVTLGPYGFQNFTVSNLVVGNEWYSGKYFLIVKTPLNNMMYREIQLTNPTPNLGADLVPTNLFTWGSTSPGGQFFFSYTLKNAGLLSAGPCKVRCCLSQDLTPDANDLVVWTTPVNTSTSGSNKKDFTVTTAIMPTNAVPNQEYYFIIWADYLNQVAETVEWNNTVSVKIKVAPSLAPAPEEAESRTAAPETKMSPASISVSPNPASDYVNIAFRLDEPAMVSYYVYDQTGHAVSEMPEQALEPGDYLQEVNLRDIQNGVYFVRAMVNGEPVTEKIVVQR